MDGFGAPPLHEVSGVIHCHSTYSDGMESVPFIADAATKAGLDFLIMTDHDTLAPLLEIGEQWHQDTLLLLGCEISPRHNHFLAYGITKNISPHMPPAEYTAAVAEQGGLGFMAHPFEHGSRIVGQNEYSWNDWSVAHYTGMEIWNYFSAWVGSCQTPWTTFQALTNWHKAKCFPDSRTLGKWDELGKSRRVCGIGGLDAHGIKESVLGRRVVIHPYRKAFGTVRTHLMLTEPFKHKVAEDRQLVMDALREGRCFVANHLEGDPTGFVFLGRAGGNWYLMGQEIVAKDAGSAFFSTRIPYRHHGKPVLRILKDGVPIAETTDCDLQAVDDGPGVYRVEAWMNGRPWILSNPIYVREGQVR